MSKLLRHALGLALAISSGLPQAQEWPTKPLRIVVIAAPGGIPDGAARLVAAHLPRALGQQVVVENKPGAGGNIATDAVAKAAPDGHTLLLTGNNHAVNAALIPNPGFDYERDVVPVSLVAEANMMLVATPSLAAGNLAELIALAKRKPGQIAVAISPIGTPNHLAAELIVAMAGVELNFVLYKGIGQSLPDLMSGQVHIAVAAVPSVLPHANAGRLKVLGDTRTVRSPQAPEVPTLSEAGLPGFDVNAWVCLMVTGGTPPAVIERLSAEVRKVLAMPEVREVMLKQGLEPHGTTPAELQGYLRSESAKWAGVLKNAKVRGR